MFTTTQAAEFLDVKFYQILYAHKAKHIQEPRRVAGARSYTEQEVIKMAEHFGVAQETVFKKISEYKTKEGISSETD